MFDSMFDDDMGGGMGGRSYGRMPGRPRKPRKVPPIKRTIGCTLEELYTGCNKRMKITKSIQDESGRRSMAEKILEINVKPGWKAGTKITFTEEGDVRPGKCNSSLN